MTYSKNSQLNLGWTELLGAEAVVDEETGINAGVESNVSHLVVTTTPDVECLACCCCSC